MKSEYPIFSQTSRKKEILWLSSPCSKENVKFIFSNAVKEHGCLSGTATNDY